MADKLLQEEQRRLEERAEIAEMRKMMVPKVGEIKKFHPIEVSSLS